MQVSQSRSGIGYKAELNDKQYAAACSDPVPQGNVREVIELVPGDISDLWGG